MIYLSTNSSDSWTPICFKVVKSAGLRCGFKTKNWGDYEQNLLLLVVNALTAMQFLQFLPGTLQKKGVKHVLPMSCELRISSFLSSILALRGSKHQGYQGEV